MNSVVVSEVLLLVLVLTGLAFLLIACIKYVTNRPASSGKSAMRAGADESERWQVSHTLTVAVPEGAAKDIDNYLPSIQSAVIGYLPDIAMYPQKYKYNVYRPKAGSDFSGITKFMPPSSELLIIEVLMDTQYVITDDDVLGYELDSKMPVSTATLIH